MEVAAGVFVSPYLLGAIGVAIGLVSGFVGVGGGYLLTPTLIILGFPSEIAVGTGLALIAGNSVIAVVRHRQLGHVDLKMGLIMTGGTLVGTEVGVRLLNTIKAISPHTLDIVVLGMLILSLTSIGTFMYRELAATRREMRDMSEDELAQCEDMQASHMFSFFQGVRLPPVIHFTKSHLRISGWIVLALGLFTGALSGLTGVGGGFVLTPSLIYIVGQSSVMAVGTSLLGVTFASAFGCLRHAMFGHVNLAAALVMLLGTALGTQAGALGTAYVKGLAVRYVLAFSVITAIAGPAFKMAYFLTGRDLDWLNRVSVVLTITQIFVPVSIIVVLLVMAIRYRHGGEIPPSPE